MKAKILVVAAHPDDEVLGCGATMALLAKLGHQVHVTILGEGLTSRDPKRNRTKHQKDLSFLSKAAIKANESLGVAHLDLHPFPDNRMDSVDLIDIVKVVEAKINRFKPEVIYTHFSGDLNIDHEITHRAVLTAARPQPGSSVRKILSFEVPSGTGWRGSAPSLQFTPQVFTDVSKTFPLKLKALEAYAMEMRPSPHARSVQGVKSLAAYRGATVGVNFAEAFFVERILE